MAPPGGPSDPQLDDHCTSLVVDDELVAEQTRILDAELLALLTQRAAVPRHESPLLPGFDSLTYADLAQAHLVGGTIDRCPDWCVYADSTTHTDGFDSDPETAAHHGVRHTVQSTNGGSTFGDDNTHATVSLQLEQDRDRTDAPRILLGVDIKGVEHAAYLTTVEADALRQILTALLNNA